MFAMGLSGDHWNGLFCVWENGGSEWDVRTVAA